MTEEIKLGPKGFDKIAILGSAPSSTMLAPFEDKSWAVWCTSPSVFASVASKRSDVWFEVHRWLPYPPGNSGKPGTRPWFSPEFRQFLREYQGPVFMSHPQSFKDEGTWEELVHYGPIHADIPHSIPYPFGQLLKKHGPFQFTSSISEMLALAIECQPKVIGLFGVDMAAETEWAYQRPGCQHFVGLAQALGIEIVLPPESDLMRHSTIYGYGEHNERHIRLREILMELESRKANIVATLNQAQMDLHHVNGRLDQMKYVLDVWSDDLQGDLKQAISFAGSYGKPPIEKDSTGAEVLALGGNVGAG